MPSCSLSLALYASALLLPWLIDWRAFVPPPGVLFNHNKVLTQTGADGNSKENTDDVMSAEEREWRERKNRINAREKRDRIEREERHLQISNDAKRSATHKNSARSSSLKKMHDQERREFKRRAFVNPGEMKASSYRYLRYENCPTNGINHQYANLLAMIEDAVMLDRIAVIPKVSMNSACASLARVLLSIYFTRPPLTSSPLCACMHNTYFLITAVFNAHSQLS